MTNNQTPEYKSGFVAVVGRPSVGKSTLINSFLQQKIASVSPRPQTTRRKQLAILTSESAQVIFIDTPGIHKPVHKLGQYLNQVALDTFHDVDLILWLVDASEIPQPEDLLVSDYLAAVKDLPQVLMILNKIDLLNEKSVPIRFAEYQALMPSAKLVLISARKKQGIEILLSTLMEYIPEGPRFYDPDQVTDLYERDISVDLIRESVLYLLKDEVPHAVAVRLDDYYDENEDRARISATLLVERDLQKGILIGQGGQMIKQIGTKARQEIESLTGRKVFLELRVKVQKNWRDDPSVLKLLGYQTKREE